MNCGCYAGMLRVRTEYAGSDGRNVAHALISNKRPQKLHFEREDYRLCCSLRRKCLSFGSPQFCECRKKGKETVSKLNVMTSNSLSLEHNMHRVSLEKEGFLFLCVFYVRT